MNEQQTNVTSPTCDDTKSSYIERVNSEREKIHAALNTPQSCGTESLPVFEKYRFNDLALWQLLQKPENYAELLNVNEADITGALNVELLGLQDQLIRAVQLCRERENELQRGKDFLRDNREFLENNVVEEPINRSNVDKVQANIRTRLIKEKEQLKIVMSAMFKDDDQYNIRNMLASLANNKIKDEHGYTTFEDQGNVRENIRLILKTGLFEEHPDDPLSVRMIDL